MKRELLDNTKVVPMLNPTITPLSAGVANGLVIDRINFLSGVYGLAVGVASGTPTSYTVSAKLQTGDLVNGSDMADFIPCQEATVITSADLIADNTFNWTDVDLIGAKKYIRAVVTVAFVGGTTPAIPVNAYIAIGDPEDTRNI